MPYNRLLFWVICLISTTLVKAQEVHREVKKEQKDYRFRSFLVGCETGGQIAIATTDTAGRVDKHLVLAFGPNISYYPNGTTGFGVLGYYQFVKSDFVKQDPLYGLGVFVRQYSPWHFKSDNDYRFNFFGELSFHFLNYYRRSFQGLTIDDRLVYQAMRLNLGCSFRIWKGFQIEASVVPELFLNPMKPYIIKRLSLEYHF